MVNKNAERKSTLQELFRDSGCEGDRLTEQPVKHSKLPNVICTLPGETAEAIVVGAHFDAADKGGGVVDNWSGAALLPSLFQSLSAQPRRHTFVFIGFTDEEKGLIGSEYYAGKLTREEKSNTTAMVNMDTLGLSSTRIWASHADRYLQGVLLGVSKALALPVTGVDVEQVGSTDSESFRKRKIRSMTIHSLTQATLPVLHSSADNMGEMKLDDYYDSYRLIAAFLAFLDQKPGTSDGK